MLARLFHRNERGQILMLSAVLLPVLLGFSGLAVDVGLSASLRRDTQNSADSAALAGAGVLLDGGTVAAAKTAAATFVTERGYACPSAACVNIPPASGPHTGNSNFVEVVLSHSRQMVFMRVLGINTYVSESRAVAEAAHLPKEYALIVLKNDCPANNTSTGAKETYSQNSSGGGLTITGGGAVVNSACEPSATESGTSHITADFIDYNSDGRWVLNGGGTASPAPNPIGAPVPDPIAAKIAAGTLIQPVPGSATICVPADAGVNCTSPDSGGTAQNPALNSISNPAAITLHPGTYYGGIKISGSGATVTFLPGLYVFAGGGFEYTGGRNIDGSAGVTFFNTGDPAAKKANERPCSGLKISGSGSVVLNAPTTGPYAKILIWQDPACTADFDYAGSTNTTTSIIYLPTARLNVSGGGTLGANQVIVGTFDYNGNNAITINYQAGVSALMPKARLVE